MSKDLIALLQREGLEELELNEGQFVLREKERSDSLFILVSGRLRALSQAKGRMIPLHYINPHAVLGVFSFFREESHRTSAFIRVEQKARLIKISREKDDYLNKKFPTYRQELLRMVVKEFQRRLKLSSELHKSFLDAQDKIIVNEKMATVGRIAASLAHELNNNTTVVRKGVEFLVAEIPKLLWGRLTATEATLFNCGIERGYTLSYREIRKRAEELQGANGHDLATLKQVVEMHNGSDQMEMRRLMELSAEEIRQHHTFFLFGTKLRNLDQASRQITDVVRNFKALGRPPSKLEDTYIEDTVNMAIELMKEQLEDVEVRIAGDLSVIIEARKMDLVQLWGNFISNSVDAMQGSGEIDFNLHKANGQMRVLIEDTGPGLPENLDESIFEPHISTKTAEKKSGMGLGLTICKQIVSQHQGNIEVIPSQTGACFRVTLPIGREIR